MLLANTNYDPRRMARYVRRFIERGVAGVAIMTEFDSALAKELSSRNVAVVFLDSAKAALHVSKLSVDYDGGIDEVVRHLAALGHRRIAYVGGPRTLRSARRRLDAFRRSIKRCLGVQPAVVLEGDFRTEGGRRTATEILAHPSRQTAVVVANDMMALGVMQECRSAGLVVPRDLSVVGFDDIALAALSDPALTTVSLSRQTLGRRALEALVATIGHPNRVGVEIPIETSLVVRASTGPAPPAR